MTQNYRSKALLAMTAGLLKGEVYMKKFTSKIKLVLILIALFAVLDILDDSSLTVIGGKR